MLNNVTIYTVKAVAGISTCTSNQESCNNVKITRLIVTPSGLIFVTFIIGVEWAGSIHIVAIDNNIF